jgi:hypothetical protein
MSNSKNMRSANYRWKLLSSVSALTLLGSAYASGVAEAAQSDGRPPVWLELGWQFESVSGSPVPFMPPFTDKFAQVGAPSADIVQKVMAASYGAESGISFQPEGTNWVLSASIRYGRAHGHKQSGIQTNAPPLTFHTTGRFGQYPSSNPRVKFQPVHDSARASASNSDTHAIVDFQAGRDFGLGISAHDSTSVLSAGVRFAQFNAKAAVTLAAVPDFHFAHSFYVSFFHAVYPVSPAWHDYAATSQNHMNFRGAGPSISWKASVPVAGNAENGELTLDWGANAAVLFGRQTTRGQHQATGRYKGPGHYYNNTFYGPSPPISHNRSRRVAVPNVGGFAGLSLQWNDAKLSLGYRGDFFFNALDTGIDTRHDTTRGYYGPFASISIGLGGPDN